MSLQPEQLENHCTQILKHSRIRNNIVVLCEGSNINDIFERRAIHEYSRMEAMSDANFYKACLPKWWREKLPRFFNCGDRKDVINTYFKLLELHKINDENTWLSPEKLFALIDLDIQDCPIENYLFSDTEQIFHHLYDGMNVNQANASQHRIWVTGLIHKEAYFLLPELQEVFDNLPLVKPIYNNHSVFLENIYSDIADDICTDIDLKDNLLKACDRIRYCADLDCSDVNRLRDSWKDKFQKLQDDLEKEKMIFALLTIRKAKEYWLKITHPKEWSGSEENYKDQILLSIADFYSAREDNPKYHLSVFFKILHQEFLQGK